MRNLVILSIIVCIVYGFGWWKFLRTKKQLDDKDSETKITVAEINSFKNQMDQDSNDNGIPDQLEIEKLKIQVHHNQQKMDLENRKLDAAENKHKEEIKIKEKQIKSKPKKDS